MSRASTGVLPATREWTSRSPVPPPSRPIANRAPSPSPSPQPPSQALPRRPFRGMATPNSRSSTASTSPPMVCSTPLIRRSASLSPDRPRQWPASWRGMSSPASTAARHSRGRPLCRRSSGLLRGAVRSNSRSDAASPNPTPPTLVSISLSGRPAPTRCRLSAARSAIRGKGARRASSGPHTPPIRRFRGTSGMTSTGGSTTITGSSRCSRTGSRSQAA